MGRIILRQESSQHQQGENCGVTYMSLLGHLQWLDLDKASPQFYEQLSGFLQGKKYRDAVPNLQGEDLVWRIEYLDSVSLQTSCLAPYSTPA